MKNKLVATVLALMMVGTVLMNVSMVSANTPPPPSDIPDGPQYIDGNWTVAGAMSFTDELIYLTGTKCPAHHRRFRRCAAKMR